MSGFANSVDEAVLNGPMVGNQLKLNIRPMPGLTKGFANLFQVGNQHGHLPPHYHPGGTWLLLGSLVTYAWDLKVVPISGVLLVSHTHIHTHTQCLTKAWPGQSFSLCYRTESLLVTMTLTSLELCSQQEGFRN